MPTRAAGRSGGVKGSGRRARQAAMLAFAFALIAVGPAGAARVEAPDDGVPPPFAGAGLMAPERMLAIGRPERIFAGPRFQAGLEALLGREQIRNPQWDALVRLLAALPEAARPGVLVAWLSSRPYVADRQLRGVEDHWDSLAGFLAHGGDCEEFAIAAYRLMRASGLDDDSLAIVLASPDGPGPDHAYLLARIGGRIVTIDPLATRLKAAQGPPPRPVVAFNARRVWLLAAAAEADAPAAAER